MEIVESSKDKLIFRAKISESLANAIRRSVHEVPVLAIDDIEIFKNDSALYDEVLALRLGLIPLKTEKGMSSKTKIDLKLVKTGPCTVYASDLKGAADVIYPKIPITILGEEHKLELVATARLGIGLEHAKFVPGLCYYRHLLEIKSSPEIDRIVQSSKSSVNPKKEGSKWICDLSDAEVDSIRTLDKEAISDSEELLFIIESYGNMLAKDILVKAIKALEDNLDEFEKAIK